MRNIFKEKKTRYVSKVVVMLVLMCVIAAMTEVRLNPKRVNTENVTEINFQY